MAKKQKNAQESSLRRFVFLANIVLLIGIISLTVYDHSKGESIFDHTTSDQVLSAQATPTPTFAPQLP